MSDDEIVEEETEKKPQRLKGVLFPVLSAVASGAAVAAVTAFAPIRTEKCVVAEAEPAHVNSLMKNYKEVEFVNLDPLVITLGPNATSEYLKINVSIETAHDKAKAAEHLKPRFRDVLNTYLRAVDERDLAEPAAMTRLRAQMLRRLQVVADPEIVSDLLITDFVLN